MHRVRASLALGILTVVWTLGHVESVRAQTSANYARPTHVAPTATISFREPILQSAEPSSTPYQNQKNPTNNAEFRVILPTIKTRAPVADVQTLAVVPESEGSGTLIPVKHAQKQLPEPRPTTTAKAPSAPRTPRLADVLRSVDAAYPALIAARQEQVVAAGKALSRVGAFDLKLKGYERQKSGSYDNKIHSVALEQQTPFHGISYFTKYRIGANDFPSYNNNYLTAELGELSAGITIPLLRDRAIDEPRAELQQAELERLMANPFVQRVRIELFRDGAQAYWKWVATMQKYQIAKQLLKVAEDRNEGIREKARLGQIADIEVKVNDRTIASRRAKLVAAERAMQQAGIKLSLFYRDGGGSPVLPPLNITPPEFPKTRAPNVRMVTKDVQIAWDQRPELRELQLMQQQVQVKLRLSENQLLPGLYFSAYAAEDMGKGKSFLDRNTYVASLTLDVPIQRRKARGKTIEARAKLGQLVAKQRLNLDKIQAEVRDAVSALDRAYALVQQLEANVKLAREVAEAEREKFRLGTSTIVIVNLQELAAFEAELDLVNALTIYFMAYADYRAALGIDACPPGGCVAPPIPDVSPHPLKDMVGSHFRSNQSHPSKK